MELYFSLAFLVFLPLMFIWGQLSCIKDALKDICGLLRELNK